MIKALFAGCWGAIVALASAYAVIAWQPGNAPPAGDEAGAAVDQIKTKLISVPVITEGKVQGYVVAQFLFEVHRDKAVQIPDQIENLLRDGAFRVLYAGERVDFRKLQKHDLEALSKTIVETINARVNQRLVRAVLIQNLNYLTSEDIRASR